MVARPRAAVSWSGGKDSLAAVAADRDRPRPRLRADDVRRERRAQPLARTAAGADRGAGGAARAPVRDGALQLVHLRRGVHRGAAGAGGRTASRTWCSAISCIPNTASGRKRGARRPGVDRGRAAVRHARRRAVRRVRRVRREGADGHGPRAVARRVVARAAAQRRHEGRSSRRAASIPCGERGEYHTAVVDSPLFSHPVAVTHGERVRRGECVALDLIPDAAGD